MPSYVKVWHVRCRVRYFPTTSMSYVTVTHLRYHTSMLDVLVRYRMRHVWISIHDIVRTRHVVVSSWCRRTGTIVHAYDIARTIWNLAKTRYRNFDIGISRYLYRSSENWLRYRVRYWTSISKFCDFDIEGLNSQKLQYRSWETSIEETSISKFLTSISKCSDIEDFDIEECTFDIGISDYYIGISRYRSFWVSMSKLCSSISRLQWLNFTDFTPVLYCLGCCWLQVGYRLQSR